MKEAHASSDVKPTRRTPWSKGKLVGAKPPLRPSHVWSIRTKLQIEAKKRNLALFNLAIDSKLRGCDVVAVRVDDVAPSGYSTDRATIRQKKTGRPVRFELTDQTRMSIDDYLRLTGRKPGQFLFAGRGGKGGLTTRQYARLVPEWVASIGLDPVKFGTHSQRRTKAVLIYRRTGNLRAVQLLLGHSKIADAIPPATDMVGGEHFVADRGTREVGFCIVPPDVRSYLART
jgi:integrase